MPPRKPSSPVEIERVVLYWAEVPLVRPFTTSFGTEEVRSTILVKLVDAEGTEGWGEVPVEYGPWYCYETIETALHVLKDFVAPKLPGAEFASVEDYLELVKRVRGHRVAKGGVEMALWDLFAKREGVPLAEMLGGVRDRIVSGVSIGIQRDVDTLVRVIQEKLEEGYCRIKIKIKPGWDVGVVERLRREFPDVPLQVDANAAYTLSDVGVFKKLDEFDLLMVEQPLGYDDLADHAELQRRIRTPICLDESIKDLGCAKVACALGSCKIINIKPPRVGGHLESIRIHDFWKDRGMGLWIGGMLETGVGRGHLVAAATLPGINYPSDISASSRWYEEDIVEPPWEIRKDSTMEVPKKPGIGVEVVEDRVEKHLRKKIEFGT